MKNKIRETLKVLLALFCLIGIMGCASALSQRKPNLLRSKQKVVETNVIKKFEIDEREIFRLVNQIRGKHNLSLLVWDEQLAQMAREYSERMASEDFFNHVDPEGGAAARRAKKSKLKNWSKIGENLFAVERIPHPGAFAVKAWMKSLDHELVILDADWTTTGVGIAEADDGEIYITQLFIQRYKFLKIF